MGHVLDFFIMSKCRSLSQRYINVAMKVNADFHAGPSLFSVKIFISTHHKRE